MERETARETTDRGGGVGRNGVDANDLTERFLKAATHSVCWTSLERIRERLEPEEAEDQPHWYHSLRRSVKDATRV